MNDNKQITDQEIEKYLEGKDELSAAYAASKDLRTPEHLEFTIKRMARDAEHNTGNHRPARKNIWFIPLSIAATIVIAISLVFYMYDQPDLHRPVVSEKTDKGAAIVSTDDKASIEAALDQKPESIAIKSETANKKHVAATDSNKHSTAAVAKSTTESNLPEKQEKLVREDSDFELPEHLREMVQPASASDADNLLPSEILKTWTREQWRTQVVRLRKAGKNDLAKQYINEYPVYFPGEHLEKQD